MNVYGIFSRKLKFLLLKKMKYFLNKINKISFFFFTFPFFLLYFRNKKRKGNFTD